MKATCTEDPKIHAAQENEVLLVAQNQTPHGGPQGSGCDASLNQACKNISSLLDAIFTGDLDSVLGRKP